MSATADKPLTATGVNVTGVRGQFLDDVLVAAFSDADPDGQLSDFSATINWGDRTSSVGTIVATGSGNYRILGDHTYTENGTYGVSVLILDVLGSMASTTSRAAIGVVALQIDALDPTKQSLVVSGTLGNDHLKFIPQGNSGNAKVILNGVSLGVFQFSGRLIAYGQAGNDTIVVTSAITKSAWLFGGDGNDVLKGGSGANVLIGGNCNDEIIGGSARDLMIGGTGADRITGNTNDDILIAGTTSYDASDTALGAILAEWTSARSYADRVANIGGPGTGSRLNGSYFLKSSGPGQTVFDDGDKDTLTGSAGNDLFFGNFLGRGVLDLLTDLLGDEARKDL